MTSEQQAAWVIAQSANAMIEALGMAAENQHRLSLGHSIAYGEDAFASVSSRNGIDQNSLVSLLMHGAMA